VCVYCLGDGEGRGAVGIGSVPRSYYDEYNSLLLLKHWIKPIKLYLFASYYIKI
jgi:hypothetical protein